MTQTWCTAYIFTFFKTWKNKKQELMCCYYSKFCPPSVCFLLRNSGLSGPKMHFYLHTDSEPSASHQGRRTAKLILTSLLYTSDNFTVSTFNKDTVARWCLSFTHKESHEHHEHGLFKPALSARPHFLYSTLFTPLLNSNVLNVLCALHI